MKIEDVAKICHEAFRAYQETQGNLSLVPWELLPEERRRDVIFEMAEASRYPSKVEMPAMKRTIYRAVHGIFKNQEI